MSRVGLKPIPIPKGVKVAVAADTFTAEGPKGKVVAIPVRRLPGGRRGR